jgi:hypothetical protein
MLCDYVGIEGNVGKGSDVGVCSSGWGVGQNSVSFLSCLTFLLTDIRRA